MQALLNVTKAEYDEHLAASNLTIQHTVADAVDGLIPERVTDIVVEEEEEEGGRSWPNSNMRHSQVVYLASMRSIMIRYKITLKDPTLAIETVRAKLQQAAREGVMDSALRIYAARFGATNFLQRESFGEPQVTATTVDRTSSRELTGVQVALLVVGILLGLVALALMLYFVHHQVHGESTLSDRTGVQDQVIV